MKAGLGTVCIVLTMILLASRVQAQDMPSAAKEYHASQVDAHPYNQVLADALLMQLKADSLGRMARDRRIHAREIPDETMKGEMAREASRLENEARLMQAEADRLFSLARRIREEDIASGTEETDLVLLKTVNGIRVYAYQTEAGDQDDRYDIKDASDPERKDDVEDVSSPDMKDDVEHVSDPDAKDDTKVAPEETGTSFDILPGSPYGETNPFPSLTKVQKGLVYHIQLGAFSSSAAFDEFHGIVPVFEEVISERNLLKYYAGMFTDLQSVTRALEKIKAYGFDDAFIVAFFDGRQITTEEAREIEFAEFRL